MTRTALTFALSFCLAAALAAVASTCAHADTYSPQFLFSLDYGEADDQIGVCLPPDLPGEAGGEPPAGPTAIGVADDGTVYIADDCNDCVKRFDTSGRLVMRTEGDLDNIQQIVVDTTGNVYALAGAGMGLLVKFGPDGAELRRTALWAPIPRDLGRDSVGDCARIRPGPDDQLCLRFYGPEGRWVALIDADGQFVRDYDGYACTPSGKIVSYQHASADPYFTLEVRVSDLQSRPVAAYVAAPRLGDPAIYRTTIDEEWGFSKILFDAADCMYTTAGLANNDPCAVLTEDLRICGDLTVARHDPAGRPVAYLRVPTFPFVTGTYLTVDRKGDIYHLAYGPASVDVVRYRLDTSVPEVHSLWVLPTISRPEATYVHLPSLATHLPMTLEWDPDSRQAALWPEPTPDHQPQPILLTADDEGVLVNEDQPWVSVGLSVLALDAPLKTDPSGRVAYFDRLP